LDRFFTLLKSSTLIERGVIQSGESDSHEQHPAFAALRRSKSGFASQWRGKSGFASQWRGKPIVAW
jgi:hypothetical protein